MSRKLDPKIIRKGDYVKVINPHQFVRCGYPISFADMCERVRKEHMHKIDSMMESILGKPEIKISKTSLEERWSRHYNIVKIIAYHLLKKEGFGGNERKIFTEERTILKDVIGKVIDIRYVKTGTRVPASRYSGGYDGYDYEPPYLDNEKTNKILDINLFRRGDVDEEKIKRGDSNIMAVSYPVILWNDSVKIEAKNVEKLSKY